MPLSATSDLVASATAAGTAIMAFNVITVEHAEGVAEGVERAGAAALIQLSENTVLFHGGRIAPLLAACAQIARDSSASLGIHLDHFQDVDLVTEAIATAGRFGATSIMVDAAHLPYADNVERTRSFARAARAAGLWVEAELGEIGGKGGAHASGARTDPHEAAAFAEATEVDGLAVAVGSTHAMTTRDAELDHDLIRTLAAAVSVPLVLHGSSGVSDDRLRKAVEAGIRKINVGTALNVAYTSAIRNALSVNPSAVDPRGYLQPARQAIGDTVADLCRVVAAPSTTPGRRRRRAMNSGVSTSLRANPLRELIERHKAGQPVGICSVCSAHPTVVEAAIAQAADDGSQVLIEATSNQVDQFGGYTGLRPADFRDLVLGIADRYGFPRERVTLGGDHLGPNRWQDRPADVAMAEAGVLIDAYVGAGYTKIHLDCSMSCADDPAVLSDDVVAARSARLLQVAERTAHRLAIESPVYVIGTEVPVPGGAHETLHHLVPTSADRARRTIAAHRAAFAALALDDVWPRVIALVVQPGVEFDHDNVIDYERSATADLRQVLDAEPHLVFEAHSTDYQRPSQLRELVEDHWAVLKVGPALTFAMREALFALARIEIELVARPSRSNLIEVVERRMLADPTHWAGYYGGDPLAQRTSRRYSYSDRLRYYWADGEVDAARQTLLDNLDRTGVPLPLISQFLPGQYDRIREGQLEPSPQALVLDRVRDALRPYARACLTTGATQ